MKIMCPSCGFQNAPIRKTCARCSTALPAPPEVRPESAPVPVPNAPKTSHAPVAIQVRSQSCDSKLEKARASNSRVISSLLILSTLPFFFIYILPYLSAIVKDEPLEYVETPSFGVLLFCTAVIVAAIIAAKKLSEKANESFDFLHKNCSLETLIVDSEKIYGSTATETFSLPYNMISGVRFRPGSRDDYRLSDFENDVLEILDLSLKVYRFYSFSNCKELCTVINMNLQSNRR